MDKNDVRAAVSQAKFNEEASLLLGIEIIFMSIYFGDSLAMVLVHYFTRRAQRLFLPLLHSLVH